MTAQEFTTGGASMTPLTPGERDSVNEFFYQELKAGMVTARIWHQLVTERDALRAENDDLRAQIRELATGEKWHGTAGEELR